MTLKQWAELAEQDYGKYKVEYRRWMQNPENSHNCENCPENSGYDGLPCGQQNCWVDLHCE